MMPLRFRAWHPEEKKMYHVDIDYYMTMHEFAQEECMPMDARKNGLMQSTGLLDKNGVEIFEGDIVQWPKMSAFIGNQPYDVGIVVWDKIDLRYEIQSLNGKRAYLLTKVQPKVIGNIHKNPELLSPSTP